MGKFDGILICTDLDGTLYRNDKTISKENKEAISYFKQEGGYFTFITGRMPYYSLDAYYAVEPNVAFGCLNGGALYDGAKKEYVWTCDALPEVMELVRCIDDRFDTMGIQICGFDRSYFLKDNSTMEYFRQVTKVPYVTCGYEGIAEPVAKILLGTDFADDIVELERMLKAHPRSNEFEFIRSERRLFEILPKGINKGMAITKFAEYLNIDIKNTVAVGDYNNDIAMIKTAGVGVAVSNACKEALEAADRVTVSNEEHALAQIIYDIESGKITF